MDVYTDLSEKLKETIEKAKKVPVGSFKYVKLKVEANNLHQKLFKIEKMINNFK